MPPSRQPDKTFHFEGFSLQRYTQIPNTFFTQVVQNLSHAEVRVLLYIFYRTFGWNKDRDAISVKQMIEGIKARDGRVLDEGTGLARSSVQVAIKGLVEKGIIEVHKAISPDGDNEVNVYRLRFKEKNGYDGGARKSGHGSPTIDMGVARESGPHVNRSHKIDLQQQPPGHTVSATSRAEVVVASTLRDKNDEGNADATLVNDLIGLNVTTKVAHQLVKEYPSSVIVEQIAALPFRQTAKEPAAVLVQAIKEGWALPQSYREAERRTEGQHQAEDERAAARHAKDAAEHARRDRAVKVEAYLATLPAAERAAIEAAAENRARATGGTFWKDRPLPRGLVEATLRLIAADRMGLPPLDDGT